MAVMVAQVELADKVKMVVTAKTQPVSLLPQMVVMEEKVELVEPVELVAQKVIPQMPYLLPMF